MNSTVSARLGCKMSEWLQSSRKLAFPTVWFGFPETLLCLLQHEDAENIGYVIPTPVMEHFINDYERNGHYTAFPALGIEWQKMESPFMRTALGMQV